MRTLAGVEGIAEPARVLLGAIIAGRDSFGKLNRGIFAIDFGVAVTRSGSGIVWRCIGIEGRQIFFGWRERQSMRFANGSI